MQVRKLLKEDDAVSPVIGVILMVAITVILAAVIASFVLGLGGNQQKTPTASFSWEYEIADSDTSADGPYAGIATVSHDGGDSIKTDELYLRGDGLGEPTSSNAPFDHYDGTDAPNPNINSTDNYDNWGTSNATVSGTIGEDSAVVGGDSVNIAAASDYELSLVWEPEEGSTSATLSEDTGPDA